MERITLAMTATTTLRRCVAIAATLLLIPTLAACGFGAQTNQQYQSAAGSDNRDGMVQILNAAVVIPSTGSTHGTFLGSFVNTSTSDPAIQSTFTNGVTATIESISITTPTGGTVNPMITLAPDSSYSPQPTAVAGKHGIPITVPANLQQGLNPADGAYVTMTFVINTDSAQTITMRVPVFPADNPGSYYTKYLPVASAHASKH